MQSPSNNGTNPAIESSPTVEMTKAIKNSLFQVFLLLQLFTPQKGRVKDVLKEEKEEKIIKRTRRFVESVIYELGPSYIKRYLRLESPQILISCEKAGADDR